MFLKSPYFQKKFQCLSTNDFFVSFFFLSFFPPAFIFQWSQLKTCKPAGHVWKREQRDLLSYIHHLGHWTINVSFHVPQCSGSACRPESSPSNKPTVRLEKWKVLEHLEAFLAKRGKKAFFLFLLREVKAVI